MSNKASHNSHDVNGRVLHQSPPQLQQGMRRPNLLALMVPRAINPMDLLRLESTNNVDIIDEALRLINEDDGGEVLLQGSASSRTDKSTQNHHGGCKQ